mmetsp:Transcript_17481/g.26029  ORF Transcript_17481/g.26029 Transcript_17481/m.26029 type:complete len:117 (-) Transcript_17481:777-1127(-)
MMSSSRFRIHVRIQSRIEPASHLFPSASSLAFAISAIVLSADMIASRRDPKHIDPKERIIARAMDEVTALEQQELASAASKHHVAMTPATVTLIALKITLIVQYKETKKRNMIPKY